MLPLIVHNKFIPVGLKEFQQFPWYLSKKHWETIEGHMSIELQLTAHFDLWFAQFVLYSKKIIKTILDLDETFEGEI